jgi:predicted lipid-binding transport protein (Tim44 family)
MKFYFSSAMDLDNHNDSVVTKDTLWPFTVLEYQRAALGALQGATNSKNDVAGASTAGKVIGGALTGAVGGAMIGASYGSAATPGYGTLIGAGIGAIVGGAAAFFS